jgi:sugar O-acyltransferase (sialic acid O-acetyltransferase NeuD family)
MRTELVILGGPGDGLVMAQTVRDLSAAGRDVHLLGFLNDTLPKGTSLADVPVLGTLEQWRSVPHEALFCMALHKVKQMPERAARVRGLGIPEERWATLVHPAACIADDVRPGGGTFIAAHVTVQPGARIGRFASLRAGANVGHDAVVEDFVYMGPNATLSGRAVLDEGAHLGPNAAVLDGMRVGRYAVVGLCSAVTKNIGDFAICMGVPARVVTLGLASSQ